MRLLHPSFHSSTQQLSSYYVVILLHLVKSKTTQSHHMLNPLNPLHSYLYKLFFTTTTNISSSSYFITTLTHSTNPKHDTITIIRPTITPLFHCAPALTKPNFSSSYSITFFLHNKHHHLVNLHSHLSKLHEKLITKYCLHILSTHQINNAFHFSSSLTNKHFISLEPPLCYHRQPYKPP